MNEKTRKWLDLFKNDKRACVPIESDEDIFKDFKDACFLDYISLIEGIETHNELAIMYFINFPELTGQLIEKYFMLTTFQPPLEIVNYIIDTYLYKDFNFTEGVLQSISDSLLKLFNKLIYFKNIDDSSSTLEAILLLTTKKRDSIVNNLIDKMEPDIKNKILDNIAHSVSKMRIKKSHLWISNSNWYWKMKKSSDDFIIGWIEKYDKLFLEYKNNEKDQDSLYKEIKNLVYDLTNVDFEVGSIKFLMKDKLTSIFMNFPCGNQDELDFFKFVMMLMLNKISNVYFYDLKELYNNFKNRNSDEYNKKIKIMICESIVEFFENTRTYLYHWQSLSKCICNDLFEIEGFSEQNIIISVCIATGNFEYLSICVMPLITDDKILLVREVVEKSKSIIDNFPVNLKKRESREIDNVLETIDLRILKGIKVKFSQITIGNIFEAYGTIFQKIEDSVLSLGDNIEQINCMTWNDMVFCFQKDDLECIYYPYATLKVNGI